ncbi:MAG TPA: VTT domain-containing protein [Burkholderiales bacterium]|nr:VTT domain-containing protein [Burkholderiales bacterium]
MRFKTFLPGLVLLATLIAVVYVLKSGVLSELLNRDWIDHEVRGKGIPGEVLFVTVGGVATALAIPRHLVSILGGYAFGLEQGTLLALLAAELGCALMFFYARIVGRPLVSARLGARVRRIEDFLASNPFSMTLLIRALPIGSNFATCLAAGVSRVPAWPFLLGSLVGYLPLTFAFALAGSGVDQGAAPQIAAAVLCFMVSGVIGIWLYRRYRHGKTLGEDVEKAI